MTATLRIVGRDYELLRSHLFQADRDEHGAIILAGVRSKGLDTALLARELHLLSEEDFPPGDYGYRQFSAHALARLGNRAGAERLALISCHSHPGATSVTSLSADDRAGHERVFPDLLDIVDGCPVAGIAFGQQSAAGEVWTSRLDRENLDSVEVIDEALQRLTPTPRTASATADRFDRQARIFGADGQKMLRDSAVGVIGLGGGGSLIVEQLAHLGVGTIVGIDYDVVETHNLSRIVGARERDARKRNKKVTVARRLVQQIDPSIKFVPIDGDIAHADVASEVFGCDFLFLATDTMTSRLVANAIAHAQLIPLVQIGAKVDLRPGGEIESVYVAVRPVFPGSGCLACAGLIDPVAVQQEAATEEERTAQNYLNLPEIVDPSVITLNGIGASVATNLMLMTTVGLASEEQLNHRLFDSCSGAWLPLKSRSNPECIWCGRSEKSRFARGDDAHLPVRMDRAVSTERQSWVRRLLRRRPHP